MPIIPTAASRQRTYCPQSMQNNESAIDTSPRIVKEMPSVQPNRISCNAVQTVPENTVYILKESARKQRNAQGSTKKPVDAHASAPRLPRKRKASQVYSDEPRECIEKLNDVICVGAIDLEEEENLLCPKVKVDRKIKEVFRKANEGDQTRLPLNKIAPRKKLAEKMTKFGLKNLSNDVEACLSLCLEQRLSQLLSSSIKMSKQRIDSEKMSNQIEITSHIRDQVLMINRRDKEELKIKEAESLKLQDKKVETKKAKFVQCTTAANAAAQAAIGGTDVVSRWKLMAQSQQKGREGPRNPPSLLSDKCSSHKTTATSVYTAQKNEGEISQSGRSNVTAGAPPVVARSISIKDVISAPEREPQMAKSTLLYRLYERDHSDESTA